MFFVLGVLVATLVALMVLPAIWHRAVRLTTRRIEAAVPTSIFEIHADKDLQRASFALNQRRLEIQIEALREQIMREARTLEEHRLEAVRLGHQLTARTDELNTVTTERDSLALRLAETERTLEERVSALAEATVALAARDAELQEVATTLASVRGSLAAQEAEATTLRGALAERETQLAQATSEAERLTRAVADTRETGDAEKAHAAQRLEALAVKLAAAEAAAEAAKARLSALTQSGASAEDLSLVRDRLADIAARIAAAGQPSSGPAGVDRVPSPPLSGTGSSEPEEDATAPRAAAS